MKKNEQGFSVLEILIVVVVVGLLGAMSWFVYNRQNSKSITKATELRDSQSESKKEDTSKVTNPDIKDTVQNVSMADYSDNNKTVNLKVGQKLTVSLDSTYWQFAAPSNTAVQASGDSIHTPCSQKTVPGSGCGTVSQVYVAKTKGQSLITASRVTCGEALACTAEQSKYQLTIVVN